MESQTDNAWWAMIIIIIIAGLIATWFVMLGYPLIIKIVFVDGQEWINPTISYNDSFILLLGIWLLSGAVQILLSDAWKD